ncbi:hypothetical protein BC833DRAFT_596353 [Globomyces pollinis-pini]|nr:hypothetical protein BC833DRAFT_596353 [Globomyces pollinis-pini]
MELPPKRQKRFLNIPEFINITEFNRTLQDQTLKNGQDYMIISIIKDHTQPIPITSPITHTVFNTNLEWFRHAYKHIPKLYFIYGVTTVQSCRFVQRYCQLINHSDDHLKDQDIFIVRQQL